MLGYFSGKEGLKPRYMLHLLTFHVFIFLTFCLPLMQLSQGPTETRHLRHRPDQADLRVASLGVQGDPGAAALLRGQEEPNDRGVRNQPNLRQGQLCLTHT